MFAPELIAGDAQVCLKSCSRNPSQPWTAFVALVVRFRGAAEPGCGAADRRTAFDQLADHDYAGVAMTRSH